MAGSCRSLSSDHFIILLGTQKLKECCLGLQFDVLVACECSQRVLILLFASAVLPSCVEDSRTVLFSRNVVATIRFRPVRKDLSSRLVQRAQVRAEMRGCLQNLLRHSLLWHESCAAMGERGSQQIVARSLRAAQEMFGGRQRAGPRHTLTQGKREHMLSSCRVRRDLLRLPLKASCQVQRNTHSTARSSSHVSSHLLLEIACLLFIFPATPVTSGASGNLSPSRHTPVYISQRQTNTFA